MIAYQLGQLQNLMEMQYLNGYEKVEDKGEVYSTEEVRIGTWIDGKPLYRKVIKTSFTIEKGSTIYTDVLVPHNISKISQVTNAMMVKGGNRIFPYISANTGGVTCIAIVDSTNIIVRAYNDTWGTSEWYITLEYTKTTDQEV